MAGMSDLNWSVCPWPGTNLSVLEDISIYIPSIGSSTQQSRPISVLLHSLASLYIAHNLTVSNATLAAFFGTAIENVDLLQQILGGEDVMEELVLWGSSFLANGEVERRGVVTGILGLVVVLVVLSFGSTVARVWGRWVVGGSGWKGLGWSEWTLVGGVVCSIGIASQFGGNVINLNDQGTGTIYFITYKSYIQTQIHATIEQILYHATVGLIKTSVLIFYYTLPSQSLYMRLTALFVLFINAAANIAGFFFNIFNCDPVDYWNAALTAVCVDYTLPIFVLGIANIFCDIMIWLMPMAMVWRIVHNWRARCLGGITITAAAGAVVASAFRCHLLWAEKWEVSDGYIADFSISICTAVEVNVMVVCYNIPAIRSLAIHYLQRKKKRIGQSPVEKPSTLEVVNMSPRVVSV